MECYTCISGTIRVYLRGEERVKKQINVRLDEKTIEKLEMLQDVLSQRSYELHSAAEDLPFVPGKTEWTRTEILTYAIEEMYKRFVKSF